METGELTEYDQERAPQEMSTAQSGLVRQKEVELKEMQEQIATFNQMAKQLTSQREMAIKKLNDMDVQIAELTKTLDREKSLVEFEDRDLKTKRTQLQSLKNEDNDINSKFDCCRKDLDCTSKNIYNAQLNETQLKAKLTSLKKFLDQTDEAIEDIDRAISYKDTNKLSALCNQPLTLPSLSFNIQMSTGNRAQQSSAINPDSNNKTDSPFDDESKFDPFADDDPFEGDDPFKSHEANLKLLEDDPFNPSSSVSSGFMVDQNDPFAPVLSTN